MPEIIFDALGFTLGVIWPHQTEWVAKYFIQTQTVKRSTRADALAWVNSHTAQPAQVIGVNDYDSLVKLLAGEFARAFPNYGATDPQNMIQLMAATIVQARENAGIHVLSSSISVP